MAKITQVWKDSDEAYICTNSVVESNTDMNKYLESSCYGLEWVKVVFIKNNEELQTYNLPMSVLTIKGFKA